MPSSCYHDVSLQKRQNVTWQRVRASWKSSTPQRNEIQQRCIESKAHCESCIRAVMQQPLSATLIFKCTSLFPPWMPSISIDQVKLNILFSVQISTIFSLCNVNNKHLDHGNTFPPPRPRSFLWLWKRCHFRMQHCSSYKCALHDLLNTE